MSTLIASTVLPPCSAAHPEEPGLTCTLPVGHAPVADPSGEPLTFDHANPARQTVWVQYEVLAAAA
jgi:hypothetical protein